MFLDATREELHIFGGELMSQDWQAEIIHPKAARIFLAFLL